MNRTNRTRLILDALDTLNENLLAYADELWVGIDRSRSEAEVMTSVATHLRYEQAFRSFAQETIRLETLIREGVDSVAPEDAPGLDPARESARVVVPLDRDKEHPLTGDFTWKRPWACRLGSTEAQGLTTWKATYGWFLQRLHADHPDLLAGLPDTTLARSTRGRLLFARAPEGMVAPQRAADLWYETNLSANDVTRQMPQLVEAAGLPADACGVYLREDRDA